jgi:hypothetical protein
MIWCRFNKGCPNVEPAGEKKLGAKTSSAHQLTHVLLDNFARFTLKEEYRSLHVCKNKGIMFEETKGRFQG